MELMVLEALQSEAGIKKATSEEFLKNSKEKVYIKNKDSKTVLGAKTIYINKNTKIENIYKKSEISERFRYDYSFNYEYLKQLNKEIRNERKSILVSDEWGNGKTFFIRKFMSKYNSEYEFIYIKTPYFNTKVEFRKKILSEIRRVF